MDKTIEEKRSQILDIARRYGITRVSVFGSRARGDFSIHSDIDFLIEVDCRPTAPWFPGGLVAELEQLLGKRVDIVEVGSLNPRIRDNVLREAHPL
jgi:uncharacterized protein